MKKLKYIAAILAFVGITACTPDKYEYESVDFANKEDISTAKLIANHNKLIANGKAEIDFRPMLSTKAGDLLLDHRIKEEWLEYTTSDGKTLSRHFSTSDASLIGKTITVSLKIKGTDIVSNSVNVEIVAPMSDMEEKVIPVIFHVVQTNDDISSYGGEYEAGNIKVLMDKINNVFGGIVSKNAVGVETRIRFELAQYDQFGKKLVEKGIDRTAVKEINIANNYEDFVRSSSLIWPTDKYMNILLISDRTSQSVYFNKAENDKCLPLYVNSNVDPTTLPKLLTLNELQGEMAFSTLGVLYKLQYANSASSNVGQGLIYYIGRYLGLFPTDAEDDGCEDTINYLRTAKGTYVENNQTLYKESEDCYFLSENIMDDYTGTHRTISKNQAERIHWVLENCPDRSAWKSKYAFTGK